MSKFRSIADEYWSIRTIYIGTSRKLIEELGQGFKCAQDTDAGDRCDKSMPVRGYTQGVSFVNRTGKRFVDVVRISRILLDYDTIDVRFRGI